MHKEVKNVPRWLGYPFQCASPCCHSTPLAGISRQDKLHVGKPPLKLKTSYSNPSASAVSRATKNLVRGQISAGVETAHQLGAELDAEDPERQAAEANVAFLKYLVDPHTFLLGSTCWGAHAGEHMLGEHMQMLRDGMPVDLVRREGPDRSLGMEPTAVTGGCTRSRGGGGA